MNPTGLPTLSQIHDWQTAHLTAAAQRWHQAADRWTAQYAAIDDAVSAPAGTVWRGDGSDAAQRRMADDRAGVEALARRLRAAARVAVDGGAAIDAAKQEALLVIRAVNAMGFEVHEDLAVTGPVGAPTLAMSVRTGAAQLAAADQLVAGELARLTAGFDTNRETDFRQCFAENFREDLGENMVQGVFVGGAIGALRGAVVGVLGGPMGGVGRVGARIRRRGGQRRDDLGTAADGRDLGLGLPVTAMDIPRRVALGFVVHVVATALVYAVFFNGRFAEGGGTLSPWLVAVSTVVALAVFVAVLWRLYRVGAGRVPQRSVRDAEGLYLMLVIAGILTEALTIAVEIATGAAALWMVLPIATLTYCLGAGWLYRRYYRAITG